MNLNIKQFTVLNTTNGKMPINGRFSSSVLNTIKSYNKIAIGTIDEIAVPGTPATISSGALFGSSHMSTSYIKIIRNPSINPTIDSVYIPDGILRIGYISGICVFDNTLLYGFATSTTTPLTDITFNVAFARNLSQTYGDYVDIALPNSSLYPNLYLVIILLVNVWNSRTIVTGNICSILSTNADYNYCINPSLSYNDTGNSHFIVIQGTNTQLGILSHIVLGIEDNIFMSSDRDYNDFSIFIGSRSITDSQINDTILS